MTNKNGKNKSSKKSVKSGNRKKVGKKILGSQLEQVIKEFLKNKKKETR
jgi:hypothetical protein